MGFDVKRRVPKKVMKLLKRPKSMLVHAAEADIDLDLDDFEPEFIKYDKLLELKYEKKKRLNILNESIDLKYADPRQLLLLQKSGDLDTLSSILNYYENKRNDKIYDKKILFLTLFFMF